ncbi:gluconokinase [Bifidobacterium aquikefiricola]|uniref:Gluconokinase n=1 Tax=Bifidobacterium aquikefiricola TaxID=3059038 RepID=A0AB39U846_9BIFI
MSEKQDAPSRPIHIVVMGVSGCGKSAVSKALRDRLGLTMAEGDDFHSQASIDTMSRGIPLTDADRLPWLELINRWMLHRDALGESTVVSCSALKRSYRNILRKGVPVFFIHLVGSQKLIQQRVNARKGHFMPATLLPSQFADLEPLQPDEPGIEVSVQGTREAMIQRSIDAVRTHAQFEESSSS